MSKIPTVGLSSPLTSPTSLLNTLPVGEDYDGLDHCVAHFGINGVLPYFNLAYLPGSVAAALAICTRLPSVGRTERLDISSAIAGTAPLPTP